MGIGGGEEGSHRWGNRTIAGKNTACKAGGRLAWRRDYYTRVYEVLEDTHGFMQIKGHAEGVDYGSSTFMRREGGRGGDL